MYKKRKERLYICDIIENPPIIYPMYYIVSQSLKDNKMLHESLYAIHLCEFDRYETPIDSSAIFASISIGTFPIYKQQYIVGEFGGRLMYLESSGWKSLLATSDIFDMSYWLI